MLCESARMVFIYNAEQNHKLSDIINTTALCNFSVILGCTQQKLNHLHRKEPRGFSREAVLAGSSRGRMGLQAGWQHAGRGRTKNMDTGIPPNSNEPSGKGTAEGSKSPDRENPCPCIGRGHAAHGHKLVTTNAK